VANKLKTSSGGTYAVGERKNDKLTQAIFFSILISKKLSQFKNQNSKKIADKAFAMSAIFLPHFVWLLDFCQQKFCALPRKGKIAKSQFPLSTALRNKPKPYGQ
jgi:hypothetical protein